MNDLLTSFSFDTVEDWDMFERIMDYTYSHHIRSESMMHPVMMSEPAVSAGATIFGKGWAGNGRGKPGRKNRGPLCKLEYIVKVYVNLTTS